MLSVNSILSLDQGKLIAIPKSDAEYFARFCKVQKPVLNDRQSWVDRGIGWMFWPVRRHG